MTEWSCLLIRVLRVLHWMRQREDKVKECESNQCSLAQEERRLTSSEGRNRGDTGRIQKLIKIAVSYYRLYLALLEYTINITSFEKPKNILFAVSHNFVWNVWGSAAWISLGSWEECLHLSHVKLFVPTVFYLSRHQKHLLLFCGWFFLSFEPRSGHKTDPEERSVPILARICSIILDRSILAKITVNQPVPELLHHWSRWRTYFLHLFTGLNNQM